MSSRSPSGPSRVPIEGHPALPLFQLAPDKLHLNHGSYGALPKSVAAEQERIRADIERDPTSFFNNVLPGELRRLAGLAAQNFGGEPTDWVFVENATFAVSSILSSFPVRDGDEILTTSHAYGAVLKAMRIYAAKQGAKLVVAAIPSIVKNEDQIVEAIAQSFTPRTKLLIVDHITSPTAIVFPVARIAKLARVAGIAVLVDGAHAAGHIDIDVKTIGADWYTGNAHKWLFAPRGCGLLWTAPHRQAHTLPAVLSHGVEAGYTKAFDWVGTRDVTAWLSFEAALDAHARFGGSDLMVRNRKLAEEAGNAVAENLGGRLSAPVQMRGAMAAIDLGPIGAETEAADKMRWRIAAQHKTITALFQFEGRIWLRLSAQIYNQGDDYAAIAKAISEAKLATSNR
jgi:isopenicillin-N epimerase